MFFDEVAVALAAGAFEEAGLAALEEAGLAATLVLAATLELEAAPLPDDDDEASSDTVK